MPAALATVVGGKQVPDGDWKSSRVIDDVAKVTCVSAVAYRRDQMITFRAVLSSSSSSYEDL